MFLEDLIKSDGNNVLATVSIEEFSEVEDAYPGSVNSYVDLLINNSRVHLFGLKGTDTYRRYFKYNKNISELNLYKSVILDEIYLIDSKVTIDLGYKTITIDEIDEVVEWIKKRKLSV